MKIKILILIIFEFLQGIQSFGQTVKLTGNIFISKDTASFAFIVLKNIETSKVAGTSTNNKGIFHFDSLDKGHYQLIASYQHCSKYILNDLFLQKDSFNMAISLFECDSKYPISSCPICKQTDQVIRVGKDGILEFGEPWHKEPQKYRFPRKIKKIGYETYFYEGQELLYYVIGENSKRLYSNKTLCDSLLFCKRDKKIFKKNAP